MGDDDDDLPSGREITDEVSDRGEVTKIDTRCGLVEDDDLLVLSDGGRHNEALGLPTGQ